MADKERAIEKTINGIYSIPCDIKGWTLTEEEWQELSDALQHVQVTINTQKAQ